MITSVTLCGCWIKVKNKSLEICEWPLYPVVNVILWG
nr:MAG TPA: hypothetical protein [Caudoviricetes sp.]